MNLAFRKATDADLNFVLNSWLKSNRKHGENLHTRDIVYYNYYKKTVNHLISKSTTLVCYNPEDPDQIFGWICYEDLGIVKLFHYAYVKHTYRGLKIFQKLLLESGLRLFQEESMVTHITELILSKVRKYRFAYNPFITEARNYEV